MGGKVDLIYAKECYELVGYAYNVYNSMKYGYYEKIYQNAYLLELEKNNCKFKKEFCVKVTHNEKEVGKYFLDFLIDDRIVVELKVANDFYEQHIRQVLSYLKSTNKRLGIIILFTQSGIKYKRVVN